VALEIDLWVNVALPYPAGASEAPKLERTPGHGKQKLILFSERAIEDRDKAQTSSLFYFQCLALPLETASHFVKKSFL
jgi:hypothetical protein